MRLVSLITILALLSSCQDVDTNIDKSTDKSTDKVPEQDIIRFSPATPMPAATLEPEKTLTRIALGSCFEPSMDSNIFNEIAQRDPDAFIFLGDNVYAEDESDDPNLTSLRKAYADLAAVESFKALRQSTPLMVVWDDHDYGKDDAGGDFKYREFSESLYEYVWNITATDERAKRDGVYFEETVGPIGKRVQFITLGHTLISNTAHPAPGPEYRSIYRKPGPKPERAGRDPMAMV